MIPDLAEYRYSNISFTILNLTETVITISVDGYEPLNSLNVLFQNSNGTIKGKGKISKIVTTGATTYQITDYTLNTTYANFQADVAINPNYYLKDSPANPYPLNNHIPSIRHLHDLLKTVNPSDFEVDQALVSNKGIVNTIDKNANFGLLSHKDKKIINDAGFFTKPFSFEITSTFKSIAYLLYDDKITRLIIKGGGSTIPTFLYDLLIYANVDLNGTSFVAIINNSSILPGGYGLQFRVVKVVYNGKNYLRVDVLDSIYSSNTVNVQLHVSSFDKYRFVCENATSPIIINIGNLQTWTITNSTYSLDSKGNVKTFYIPEDESEILIAPSTDLAALLEPAYYYMLTGVETLTNKPAGLTTSFVMRIFRSGADLHVTNYLIIDSNSTIFTGTYDIVNSIIVWGTSVIGYNTGDQESADFDISELSDEEGLREFWSEKEPSLPPTPANPQTKFLNAFKEWTAAPISGGGAFAANLYLTTLDSDISGYKKIDYYFEETETELSTTLSNQELLINTYIYDLPLDKNMINQGSWSFAFMVKVNKEGENRLKFEVFLRHANNSETVLFSEYSPLITQTSYDEVIKWEKYIQGFTILSTDRLGIRIYASVTEQNVTINILIGNGRGAYFTTPLQFRHDGLRGLNDNLNFQHVTSMQISGWNAKLDYDTQIASLTTVNKNLNLAINEINAISKGASNGDSVENIEALVTLLNSANTDEKPYGRNIYIIDVTVPDYWINAIDSTHTPYTYVDDATFLSDIAITGSLKIGYYTISQLEGQKVDLTDYYDKSATDLLLGAKEDITNKSSNVDADKTSTTKYANVKAIYDWAVGKFIDSAISKTYAELSVMKSDSELVVGQLYLISDYRTKYTQPVSREILTCSVEPIIVQAITTSSFSTVAHSTLFPQDILYYSFDNNALNAPGADMGYIMRRVDTLREVDVPFDFRQVKFRRWGITATEYDAGTTYAKWSTCKKNDKLYISVIDSNIGNDPETTGTESSTLLTYKWIYVPVPIGSCVAHDSLGNCGYATFVPTGEYEDYLMFSDNTIYSKTRNFKIFIRSWHLDTGGAAIDSNIWDPVNSVFFNYGNDTYYGVYNCVINGDFFNNTFLGGFGMNQTYQIFYHNFFCGSCVNNFFQAHFRYNFFAKRFEHNFAYSWDVSRCLFGGSVESCSIGGAWYDNIFAYNLLDSNFTGYQQYNSFLQKCEESSFKLAMSNCQFKGKVQRSNMFAWQSNNIFEGTCSYNFSDGVFMDNTFNGNATYNNWNCWTSNLVVNGIFTLNTSKLLRNSTFGGQIRACIFDIDVRYMTFPAMTSVHVGKGVYSKDLSALTLTDKIYKIEMLASNNLKISYIDDFGIENSTII